MVEILLHPVPFGGREEEAAPAGRRGIRDRGHGAGVSGSVVRDGEVAASLAAEEHVPGRRSDGREVTAGHEGGVEAAVLGFRVLVLGVGGAGECFGGGGGGVGEVGEGAVRVRLRLRMDGTSG